MISIKKSMTSTGKRGKKIMQMIKIGVCDDDIKYIEIIKKKLLDYYKTSKINMKLFLFSNGNALLQNKVNLDLILLDIEMEEVSGIDIKNFLDKSNNKCKVIFISNHENKMIDAFGRNVIAFLHKSNISDIVIYLRRMERECFEHKLISLGNYQFDSYDIIYAKANGAYTNIIIHNKSYFCCIYLNNVLKKWDRCLL